MYVNKFAACMDDVERRRPSGMTERDKVCFFLYLCILTNASNVLL